ncbi:MAG: glycosyltransferase family 2 protein [Pseudomonadota bacterium]
MPQLISVIVPVLNEEDNIQRAYDRVCEVFDGLSKDYDFELIFTDNHSSDRTFELIQAISKDDPRVRAVRFARNVGYQRSIMSGYLLTDGDAVIQLDCDLQDPPEMIPEMLKLWKDGNDVVYGVRTSRKEGPIITAIRKVFYRLVNALSEDNLPKDAGDFRLIDRRIVSVLGSLRSKSPYIRGQIAAAGFKQIGFEYDRAAREHGETKFNLGALIKLSVDAIVAHSVIPLRFAAYFGFIVTALSAFAVIAYLIFAITSQSWPPGFATLAILGFFNIGVVSMFLGILGEYFIRVIEQVTIGPISIVERHVNLPDDRMQRHAQILIV